MKNFLKIFLALVIAGFISCKPDIDRSFDPYLFSILKNNTNSSLSISFSEKSFVFTEKTAITKISPIVTGTIISCSTSPILPTGLVIDNGCNISGTPSASQVDTSYIITAVNGNLTSSDSIRISVNAIGIPVTPPAANSFLYSGAPYSFTIGLGITPFSPTITGSFSSFSIVLSLPAGLFIATASGQITGNPSALSPSTSYTVTGTIASGGTNTFSFNLAVVEVAPSALSYTGSPFSFTQSIAITPLNPAITGTPSNCISVPTLPAGLSINTSCIITGTPSTPQASTAYTITASNTGGNTNTVINIAVTSATNLRIYVTI